MRSVSQQKTRIAPTPLVIKKRLLEQCMTIADLGRKLSRSRESVSRAVHGKRRYARLRKEVLEVLGL